MAGMETLCRSGGSRSEEPGIHNHNPVDDGNVTRTNKDLWLWIAGPATQSAIADLDRLGGRSRLNPRSVAPSRNDNMIADRKAFIRANTRLEPVAHVPEISLHVAEESVPIWQKTEQELDALGLPPPYWAFAWAGGQALARYVLDNRKIVAGRRVLDLAAGSGLVAIAAAMAGAAPVIAADIDAFAESAIALNAETNGVYLEIVAQDLLPEIGLLEQP